MKPPPAAASATCRLCGSDRRRLLFVKRELPRFLCGECGLIYTRPESNPNTKPLDEFDDAYLQWFAPHAADAANCQARARWLGQFAPLPGARLLDIGCGSGKWVRHLRAMGVNAEGAEPFGDLFHRFLADDNFFTRGDAADLRRAGRRPFDIVTAFDVIEHVENPGAFLDDIAALTADGGTAALCTPDSQSLHAKLAGKFWHCQNLFHISVFGRDTLIRAARDRGLELVHFSRRGRRHSCGYIVRYIFEHYLAGRKPPRWTPRLDNICLTLNLMDEMYLCFRKTPRKQ